MNNKDAEREKEIVCMRAAVRRYLDILVKTAKSFRRVARILHQTGKMEK